MSYSILIVDDSPIIRGMVRKSLDMSGLELANIFEASNGVEALQVLSDEWIDIVFADLNMPKMNGIEMVDKMAEDSVLVTTPVIIISSERNKTVIEELHQKGIKAYMKKPFRPENLRDVVQDVLKRVD